MKMFLSIVANEVYVLKNIRWAKLLFGLNRMEKRFGVNVHRYLRQQMKRTDEEFL